MKPISQPISILKSKQIKAWQCEGSDLIITFTDGSWCLFRSESDIETTTSCPNLAVLDQFEMSDFKKLGLVSNQDLADRKERIAQYLKLRHEFVSEDLWSLENELKEGEDT
jgi:hypothetical protein